MMTPFLIHSSYKVNKDLFICLSILCKKREFIFSIIEWINISTLALGLDPIISYEIKLLREHSDHKIKSAKVVWKDF